MTGRSRYRVTLCVIYTVHVKMMSVDFLVEAQNHGRLFMIGLTSKSLERFSPVWPQNRWRRFSSVWHQNRWLGFLRLCLKTGNSGLMIWASKSSRRFLDLCLKIKQTSVCRLRHKIDGGRTAWDTRQDLTACFVWKQVTLWFPSLTSRLTETRRWMVHVTPSWRLCQDQIEDRRVDAMGCVRLCYAYFTFFYILDHRDIVVFWLCP
jgi:hypothetical protein